MIKGQQNLARDDRLTGDQPTNSTKFNKTQAYDC